ncbi:MAG: DUF6531 domain-containing protein, partial [Butyrivibrio hungatei]|nr:DUF6531 domain-containing protein [Butyrivibrio hungatei]
MGFNGDNIEWHQAKIREYFNACFNEIYNPFSRMSEFLIKGLFDFVNDDMHTGPEAYSSKGFINDRQVNLVQDTLYCIQKLKSMMQGEGYSGEVALLEDFKEDLAEDDTAVIKTQHLNKIAEDFAGYNSVFNEVYPKITHIHREVENIARGCDVISRKSYTWPNPREAHLALDDFATPDKSAGFVPEFLKKFLAFHEEHSNDIEGSEFKSLLDTIVQNLHEIITGLNKGALDITDFYGTKDNISWKDPSDILAPEDVDDYIEFRANYQLYLRGEVERCQIYLYDPVNLNNGNYINDREDLNISGVYPLSVRRFYNAQSEKSGYFGKGWTSLFDMHLTKEGEDDDSKIKVLFADGHEGSYVRYFTKASTNEKKRKDNGAVSEEDSKKYDLDEVGEIEFVTTKDGRAVVKEDYE